MVVWFCKLYGRGKELVKESQSNLKQAEEKDNVSSLINNVKYSDKKSMKPASASPMSQTSTSAPTTTPKERDRIIILGVNAFKAQMGFSQKESDQKESLLVKYLRSEYTSMLRNHHQEMKVCRKLMMKRIRCCFVKHPYDYVGRKMAVAVRKVFIRQVLEETKWWHNLEKIFRIPDSVKNVAWVKTILIKLPIILACFEIAKKGGIYAFDVYSDIDVLYDLNEDHDAFTMPKLGSLPNSTKAFQEFLEKKISSTGLRGAKYPCQILDLLEDILNKKLPLYKILIGELGNVHFSPNRNSSHPISKVFGMMADTVDIYQEALDWYGVYKFKLNHEKEKPMRLSDLPTLMQQLIDKIESYEGKLSGFLVSIFGGSDVTKMKKALQKIRAILNSANERILKKDIVLDILREADRRSNNTYRKNDVTGLVKEFGKEMKTVWSLENIQSHLYNPENDYFKSQLNETQLECRNYVAKLYQFLITNDMIKKTVFDFFLNSKSKTNIDNVNEGVNNKLAFMTKHVMRSAWLFLVCTLIYTMVQEFFRVIFEIVQCGDWPIITNFRLKVDDNSIDSVNFEGGDIRNSYVIRAAARFRLNINEAADETLSAINIQVALFVYMASFLFTYRRSISESLGLKLENSLFGLSDSSFTHIQDTAMMQSLLAGLVSLTFAQYKQYLLRHNGDMDIAGRAVYLAACLMNSIAIFITQIPFYALGLPYLLSILLIVINNIIGIDAFDELPNSNPVSIFFLITLFVLLPLKFIPIQMGKVFRYLTEEKIIRKTFHITNRNRSGYDIPGFSTALFMFLPCASNSYEHLSSSGTFLAPGFSYFSNDPITRKLYRLKFEVQIFSKCLMHLFYIVSSFILINTIHVLLSICTVQKNTFYLNNLEIPEVKFLSMAHK